MSQKGESIDPAVARAIKDAREKSEILVTFALLGFVSFFLVTYFLTPRGFSEKQTFEAIPIVFGFYTPFLLLRLFLAVKRWLHSPVLYAYAILDVGILVSLFWLWHLQYSEPPPFYLKAPTFGAFFMMIALRALSFRLRFVIFTGLLSIAGWAALVSYSLSTAPKLRTNDFVTFTTSNTVLLGAEIEKMMFLGVVTGILSLAVYRQRSLLITSLAEANTNRNMSRFFSPDVMNKIKRDGGGLKPGHGELRRAAILMMDLRGFTKMSTTMSPNAVMSLVAEYQSRMVGPIFKNGGCVDKFMGDGIMSHFGAASVSATPAADCLRAMIELEQTAIQWNKDRRAKGEEPLTFGIAAALGDVIFGVVGDKDRLELTTIGDAVNLAAKLEKHTKVAGVMALATEMMFYEAEKQGFKPGSTYRRIAKSDVAGVPHPLNLVILAEREAEPGRDRESA